MSNQPKTKRTGRSRGLALFLTIGFTAVAALFCYPSFTNALNDVTQTTAIGGYESDINRIETSRLEQIRQDAVEYNQKIWEKQQKRTWYFQGYDDNNEEYESKLKTTSSSRVMGFIEIPKIKIYLPITHGTNARDLEYQVGHMYGSSLPIGGPDTHCVIAGHTGLEKVNLFTDITKLKVGDQFYVHVLNETHVYTVVDSHVTWPKEETPYLQIMPGRDLMTLYTCTPYGVNDHRLLVAAERTYPDLVSDRTKGNMAVTQARKAQLIMVCVMYGMIPFAVFVIGLYRTFRKKKPKKKKRGRGKKAGQEEENHAK